VEPFQSLAMATRLRLGQTYPGLHHIGFGPGLEGSVALAGRPQWNHAGQLGNVAVRAGGTTAALRPRGRPRRAAGRPSYQAAGRWALRLPVGHEKTQGDGAGSPDGWSESLLVRLSKPSKLGLDLSGAPGGLGGKDVALRPSPVRRVGSRALRGEGEARQTAIQLQPIRTV
jgi:hypothetical protein